MSSIVVLYIITQDFKTNGLLSTTVEMSCIMIVCAMSVENWLSPFLSSYRSYR